MGKYGYNPDVSTAINNMRNVAKEYEAKLNELRELIKEITFSNDWKDLAVKTSFLNTLNNYMKVYEALLLQMRNQIGKIDNKTSKMGALEDMFAQG